MTKLEMLMRADGVIPEGAKATWGKVEAVIRPHSADPRCVCTDGMYRRRAADRPDGRQEGRAMKIEEGR